MFLFSSNTTSISANISAEKITNKTFFTFIVSSGAYRFDKNTYGFSLSKASTAILQFFTDKVGSDVILCDQNGLLMKKDAKLLGDIIDQILFDVDQ